MTYARIVHAVLLAALPCAASAQKAATASPEVLRVTRYTDDGNDGSLRFAIEASNRAPGRYRIEIDPVGSTPYVIRPNAPLPPIKGPVRIEGAAWKKTGEFIILDGAGYIEDKGPQTCPGAVPGQFGANVRTLTDPGLALIDTGGVDISGLDIRNFCIGILVHRSSGNVVHDNRIVANRGHSSELEDRTRRCRPRLRSWLNRECGSPVRLSNFAPRQRPQAWVRLQTSGASSRCNGEQYL